MDDIYQLSTKFSVENQSKRKNKFWSDGETLLAETMGDPVKRSQITSKENNLNNDLKYFYMFEPLLAYFKLLYWCLYFPSKIFYDSEKKLFTYTETSLIRNVQENIYLVTNNKLMIIVAVVHLMDIALHIEFSNSSPIPLSPTLHITFQILFTVYMFAGLAFHYLAWMKKRELIVLLNELQELVIKINGYSAWNEKQIKYWRKLGSIIAWSFGVWITVQGILYMLTLRIYVGNISEIFSTKTAFIEQPATHGEAFVRFYTGEFILAQATNMTDKSLAYLFAFGIFFTFITLFNTFVWAFACCAILLWSLHFRLLLKQFYDTIQLDEESSQSHCFLGETRKLSTLELIKIFQRFTILLGKFNKIFGFIIFFMIITCTLFIIVNIWGIVGSDFSVWSTVRNCVYISAVLQFTVILLLAADVNSLGNSIVNAVKIRFQNSQSSGHYGRSIANINELLLVQNEVSQGMAIMNTDLLASSVGLKGCGFFTITYSFLGTVVSTVTTYAIVILQFNLPAAPTPGLGSECHSGNAI